MNGFGERRRVVFVPSARLERELWMVFLAGAAIGLALGFLAGCWA